MKLITGKVVDGRIEFPPGEIEEGATVGIVAFDDDEPVVLTEAEEQQINEALEAIARVSTSTATSSLGGSLAV